MKKSFSRVISLLLVVAILCGLTITPAFAASTVTRYNVSYSPVTRNASSGNLPTGTKTVYTGEKIYFNFQVDSSQKVKSVVLYYKDAGGSSYSKKTETATNYLRYAYFSYTVGNTTGTLKYYFKITYTNGKTTTTSTSSITVKKSPTVNEKINAFISDSRWKSGVSWGSSQKPKLSTYSSTGCCAYAADFVKYVYGSNNLRSGTKYTSASSIKTGDVIYVTPQHWMVVVSRSGNKINVAEGNYSSKVNITTYTLSGNKLLYSSGKTYKTFSYGYHY